ncbi:uncharacterized protein N7483_001021 [Penicillium malachiteum]|uniref:uncharacterized protein n=1 Tax=Penicillium malachiteum TaxID=1324776 RepID=UPI002546D7AD|nr:uncharacterized protein N7483_001021 [Penicillium malachiteum]KAJ5735896.1 hypothetical protein N7483_001021 [Penicillium malachiteum]
MLAIIPILLRFTSLATSAAIPPASIAKLQDSAALESTWEPTDSAQVLSTKPTNQNSEAKLNNFAKRTPYYFPETVPDEEEIADELFALHEAATVNNSPNGHEMAHEGVGTGQSQQLQSIGTPDKEIDILRAPLSDPDQDISPELAQSLEVSSSNYVGQNHAADIQTQVQAKTVQVDWVLSESSQMVITTPPFVPSMLVLFFIAALLCIVTVVRGVRYRR